MITASSEISEEVVIEWLANDSIVDDLHVVTDRPWARTYRVGDQRFLKVLPACQRGAIDAMPLLSRLFPEVVPNVVAVHVDHGFVLQDRHDGTDLGRRPGLSQRREMLVTYANLQARSLEHPDLVDAFPTVELSELLPTLLRYLDPDHRESFPAPARAFLSERRCRYFLELLRARADALGELISSAHRLPTTVNHCDLRPSNAAVRKDGSTILYDWDEAVAGPAGLSLHASFSGCSTPCEMLLHPDSAMSEDRAEARSLLSAYLRTLAANGYAEPEELNAGLPGAMCAGVMRYILSYSHFPPPDDEYRDDIGAIIRRRLNDLVRLGDLLLATTREATLAVVDDYVTRGRDDHACRVLAAYVAREADDAEAAARLSGLLVDSDDLDEAEATCRRLLERHPENAGLHGNHAAILLQRLAVEESIEHLEKAIGLGRTDETIARLLVEAVAIREARRHAAASGTVPTIRLTDADVADGRLTRVRHRLACEFFREYGTLLFENAFPDDYVERMHAEYLDRYQHYFVQKEHEDALRVGNRRYMITVDVAGAFNAPLVYANPFVAPVIGEQLGPKMIMGGFSSVCSLPDSGDMRIHKDHPALFPDTAEPDKLGHPSFAVTAVVPMLGFNSVVGTTRVWKGSHVEPSKRAESMEWQDPVATRGACLLMDYRLTHQGRGNRSDQVRPILTMIYHRPWFRDIVNYGQQPPLVVPRDEYEQMPEEHRGLFSWMWSNNDAPCGMRD